MPPPLPPLPPPGRHAAAHQPLRGLRMGLMCRDEQAETATRFTRAARALGVEVTVLDPDRVLHDGATLEDITRLLGRLYGAIACDGLPPAVTRRLTMAALVPVLDLRAVLAFGDEPSLDGAGGADGSNEKAQAALLAALR